MPVGVPVKQLLMLLTAYAAGGFSSRPPLQGASKHIYDRRSVFFLSRNQAVQILGTFFTVTLDTAAQQQFADLRDATTLGIGDLLQFLAQLRCQAKSNESFFEQRHVPNIGRW